jgi:clan AA aspartic protease
MNGFVTSEREAVISLVVRGSEGRREEIDALVDTGFNGFLTLPSPLVSRLALPFAGTTQAVLADGSRVQVDAYQAALLWDGRERSVLVLKTEGDALAGMALFDGHRLTVEVQDSGLVLIEALA